MKYLKTYEFYKPIKINSAKPFKIKKDIDKSIRHLQTGIKAARKKLEDDKLNSPTTRKEQLKRSKLNKTKNDKIKKLGELTFKQIKQNAYLRNNPVKESFIDTLKTEVYDNVDRGDEVICIKNKNSEDELTIGKTYIIKKKFISKESEAPLFTILNDVGEIKHYLCKRFITPIDYYKNKFNF